MTHAGLGSHQPETEIRHYGDRNLVVLFTRDSYTYHRFRQWAYCRREVAYTSGLRGKPVAADLYFPRAMESILRRLAGVPGKSRSSMRRRRGGTAGVQMRLPGFEK